jgi:hypothetical protein
MSNCLEDWGFARARGCLTSRFARVGVPPRRGQRFSSPAPSPRTTAGPTASSTEVADACAASRAGRRAGCALRAGPPHRKCRDQALNLFRTAVGTDTLTVAISEGYELFEGLPTILASVLVQRHLELLLGSRPQRNGPVDPGWLQPAQDCPYFLTRSRTCPYRSKLTLFGTE